MTDIVLTEDETGKALLAHRPDCPMIDEHRKWARPIMTMFGCEKPLPPDVARHTCFEVA